MKVLLVLLPGGLSAEELLKLWKGLFYCVWMQDKPLLQVRTTTSRLTHEVLQGPGVRRDHCPVLKLNLRFCPSVKAARSSLPVLLKIFVSSLASEVCMDLIQEEFVTMRIILTSDCVSAGGAFLADLQPHPQLPEPPQA